MKTQSELDYLHTTRQYLIDIREELGARQASLSVSSSIRALWCGTALQCAISAIQGSIDLFNLFLMQEGEMPNDEQQRQ